MSVILPSSIQNLSFASQGGKKVHTHLAKLRGDFIIRYNMVAAEKMSKPGFIIFSKDRGIAIIDVKDWDITEVSKIKDYVFGVSNDNPQFKCMNYLRDIKQQIYSCKEFSDNTRLLTLPVDYTVVLANVTRKEFNDSAIKKYISEERIIFKEQMKSPEIFIEKFHCMFPALYKPMNDIEIKCIEEIIMPDLNMTTIKNPFTDDENQKERSAEEVVFETYRLSAEQEEIAKSIGEGPRLLRGIAGTGKTMILLYRAKLLASNNPEHRILILCWNTTLATYMQQVYDRINLPGGAHVWIVSFTRFIKEYSDTHNVEENNLSKNELINRQIALLWSNCKLRYNAVFIDEGQDFQENWFDFIYNNLFKQGTKERNLLIAADDAQAIYSSRKTNWKDLGIPMVGRSKVLRTIYRNSKKIWFFAHFFLGDESLGLDDGDEQIVDKLSFASNGDFDPVVLGCRTEEGQIAKVKDIIHDLTRNGISPGNILILYSCNGNDGFTVPALVDELNKEGIPNKWITKNSEIKRSFVWESSSVKISTVASSKGLDAPVVIVLGAEKFQNENKYKSRGNKLMYVSLTRAREVVIVLHGGTSEVTDRLYAARDKFKQLISVLNKKRKLAS